MISYGFSNEIFRDEGSIAINFLKLKLWSLLPNGKKVISYSIADLKKANPEYAI